MSKENHKLTYTVAQVMSAVEKHAKADLSLYAVVKSNLASEPGRAILLQVAAKLRTMEDQTRFLSFQTMIRRIGKDLGSPLALKCKLKDDGTVKASIGSVSSRAPRAGGTKAAAKPATKPATKPAPVVAPVVPAKPSKQDLEAIVVKLDELLTVHGAVIPFDLLRKLEDRIHAVIKARHTPVAAKPATPVQPNA